MPLSPPRIRILLGALLLATGTLPACHSNDQEPAPLPGRWNLVSQHSTYTDATSGQVVLEQALAGTPGDYLEISATLLSEYRANVLYFTMDYSRTGSTLAMQGPNPRTSYSREIRELTSTKLVLHYQLPAIVQNQVVVIDATYSR